MLWNNNYTRTVFSITQVKKTEKYNFRVSLLLPSIILSQFNNVALTKLAKN